MDFRLRQVMERRLSPNIGVRRWFGREMRKLSAQDQDAIWQVLEKEHNIPREEIPPPRVRSGKTTPKQTVVVEEEDREDESQEYSSDERIFWTDAEWDFLADSVWKARKNSPADSILVLLRKVMPSLPADRRRNINSVNLAKPLIDRLRTMDESFAERAELLRERTIQLTELEKRTAAQTDELAELQKAIEDPDALLAWANESVIRGFEERIVERMTPERILQLVSPDELARLLPIPKMAGIVVEHFVERFGSMTLSPLPAPASPRVSIPSPSPQSLRVESPKAGLPRIAMVGLLADQQRVVKERIGEKAVFHFVDKNRVAKAIPQKVDVVFLWVDYISHSIEEHAKKSIGPETELVLFRGGLSRMIERLEDIIASRADKVRLG